MSNHLEWGWAKTALYNLVTTDNPEAVEEILGPIEEPLSSTHALLLSNENGDGLVVEGELEDIAHYVALLHEFLQREIAS